jgi:hypothetical protein
MLGLSQWQKASQAPHRGGLLYPLKKIPQILSRKVVLGWAECYDAHMEVLF